MTEILNVAQLKLSIDRVAALLRVCSMILSESGA